MSCVTSSIVVPRACQRRRTSSCIRIRVNCVQGAERLVEQQDLRVVDQRPGQGRPLGHAAGELVRVGVGEGLEADQAQELVRPRGGARGARRGRPGRPRCCGGRVSQGNRLGSWNISPRSALGAGDRLVADAQLARGRHVEPGDQAQERRLAAAAGADRATPSRRPRSTSDEPVQRERPSAPSAARKRLACTLARSRSEAGAASVAVGSAVAVTT